MLDATDTKQIRLKWWPSPQDYNEAVQNPRINLADEELKNGGIYLDFLGLPRPVTGSFASVYRIQCSRRDLAFRCFLRNITDQAQRYKFISDFVQGDDLPYTVTFDFLPEGIRVAGHWLPALKMEWVEGLSLDQYIVENLANPYKLWELQEKFVTMMDELRRAGIAHGDLQHGNILVCGEELRLVDYDGMFVPAMHGFQSNELGHRNYQHPGREARHFGPFLDNFSAWVIYASIRALQIDPRLLHQLGGGDDCLLFRQADFANPLRSSAFAAFEKHQDDELIALGRFIRAQLRNDPSLVPPLQVPVPEVKSLEPLPEFVPSLRQGARLVRGTLPDWIDDTVLSQDSGETQGAHSQPSVGANNPARRLTEREWLNKSWAVAAPANTQTWIPPNQQHGHAGVIQAQFPAPPPANKQQLTAQWIARTNVTTPTPLHIAPIAGDLEAELLIDAPRSIEFNPDRGSANPVVLQMFAFFNPLLWLAVWLTFSSVMNVIAGCFEAAEILWGICLVIELLIWVPDWQDRWLARHGAATMAEVVAKYRGTPDDGCDRITIRYLAQKQARQVTITRPVPTELFNRLSEGDALSVLYDETNPEYSIIYRCCRYRPVLPTKNPTTFP